MTVSAAMITTDQANAQSLATGGVGAALLAVEQAIVGGGSWATARQNIAQAAGVTVDAGNHAGLYYGAPAMAFLLHAATSDGRDRYANARQALTQHVRRLVQRRLAAAQQRRLTGRSTTFVEYDLFYGLVGLGAVPLQQLPGSDELADLLAYIVQLTEPRDLDGLAVPGWWVDHDPDPTLPTPGGHANLGVAHGAAGLLALLALARKQGRTVDGQTDAIERMYSWFDQWQQEGPDGPWWPQWVNSRPAARWTCGGPPSRSPVVVLRRGRSYSSPSARPRRSQ